MIRCPHMNRQMNDDQDIDGDVVWQVCLDCGLRWSSDPNGDVFQAVPGNQEKCRHANAQLDVSMMKEKGVIWRVCFDCGERRRLKFTDESNILITVYYGDPRSSS